MARSLRRCRRTGTGHARVRVRGGNVEQALLPDRGNGRNGRHADKNAFPPVLTAQPAARTERTHRSASGHKRALGESPYFAIIKVEQGKLLHLKIIPNEFINEEKRKGILISDWLSSKKIDKLYLKNELKKGPKLIFENSLIQVENTDFDNLDQLIEREKELSLL